MAAMVASAHRFFRQVRLRTIIACDLLSLGLMVILVLGPVISISSGQPDHDQASVSASAGEPLESSIPCDAGVLCSAFLLPTDTSAGRIAAVAMASKTADETLQRGFGDPAIDLPPPRPAA